MEAIISLVLAALTLFSVSLERTYRRVPAIEVKRRARDGDYLAELLYKAVSYGHTLKAVLWFFIGVTSAAFFVHIATTEPAWFALSCSVALIWVGFVWLPARNVTRYGQWVAARVAPLLARLLYYVHPLIDRLYQFIRRHQPITVHTGLYDKQDFLDLLERQQVQADNRIERVELDIARHALTVGDKQVRDVLTPRRQVKMVNVEDSIGPILLNELHDSGFSRFPVYEGKQDNIVGTLLLRDLMKAKTSGWVKNAMRKEVSYLHEEQSLVEALQAILKTRHHLFIVVNGFEEYVGVISMEDILEQVIGKPIVDEFDQYDDLRTVAARNAKAEHKEHTQNATEDPTEVIELSE